MKAATPSDPACAAEEGSRFTLLNDRRFWLAFAFLVTFLGFPRGMLTGWITRTGEVYSTTHPGGGDFVVFWVASRMLLEGHLSGLFDPGQFSRYIIDLYGSDFGVRWLYPPHFLFFLAPLGLFPYLVAYGLFMGGSLAAFLFVAARVWGDRSIALWLLIAPVTALGILIGQTCFIVGALFVGAIYLWDERPILAGILLGLLTVKPQFGVLIPLVLLLERRFLVIAVASTTATALISASILAFGIEPWRAFLFGLQDPTGAILLSERDAFLSVQMTVYGAARYFGLDFAAAAGLQGMSALFAVCSLIYVTLSSAPRGAKAAMLVTATYLTLPYVLYYDLAAPTFVALWLYFGHGRSARPGVAVSALLVGLASISFINGAATTLWHVNVAPVPFLALAILLTWSVRRETSPGFGRCENTRP
ncbi:DUF2029 domain-containing protein [Afifella sp. JA880]|uniref:glycosyltransferase family 87 protein n=1 Tax=Afifella sp. JA880 TaxID=2975280 RepID=UPI0021BA7F19|nr:glycosyltransferase family 87 protein [Afifella sp. JA880]MCT8268887.1 DUF2029 domain-containing protein [Afifella sp. JA880]